MTNFAEWITMNFKRKHVIDEQWLTKVGSHREDGNHQVHANTCLVEKHHELRASPTDDAK